jgi:uncharacterized protein (UPF0332 family)
MRRARSLAEQLLAQSRRLAELDAGKPIQANLRRAVSAAYYALFHLLVSESARRVSGSSSREKTLRQHLARMFQHKQMKDVCKCFVGGTGALNEHLRAILQLQAVPAELRRVAKAFVDLQEKRHLADYSVATTHTKADALEVVRRAEAAFADWQRIRKNEATNVFLLLLLFPKRNEIKE